MKKFIVALILFVLAFGTGAAYAEATDWIALHDETLSLNRQKQYDRAVVVGQKALQVAEQGADHQNGRVVDGRVAASLHDLGVLYQHLGQYAQAESFYQRALAMLEEISGPDDPSTLKCRQHFASLYRQMGRESDAVAIENRTAVVPPVVIENQNRTAVVPPVAVTPSVTVAPAGQPLAWLSGKNVPIASPTTLSGETSIVFVNHLASDVSLDWLGFDGKPTHYAVVKAGDSYLQNTRVGHVWTVSLGSSVLGAVAAGQAPGYIDISMQSFAALAQASNAGKPAVYAASKNAVSYLNGCLLNRSKASIENQEYGVVTLQFVVDPTGEMVAFKILKSSGYKELDKSAAASVSRCVFKVDTKDGKPVYTTYKENANYPRPNYVY